MLFAGGTFLRSFPLRGLTSDNWRSCRGRRASPTSFWHLTLPLICYVLEGFAIVTLLTKNAVIEELRKLVRDSSRAKGHGAAHGAVEARVPATR